MESGIAPHAPSACGAKTRAGSPCKNAGMPNGRCRLHGGKSTGPKTVAGRRACARARTKHGRYSAEVKSAARSWRKEIAEYNSVLDELMGMM